MKKLASFWNKYWMYIMAFCIPWFIVLIKGIIFDGWPIGSRTLISGDTSAQLVPFAYGIWDKVHLGENMNYTWNLGGGCDFNAVLGYYLSPFTLLILIFPRSCVVNMVQFVMILKWACLAVTMVHFFYCTKYNTLTVYKKAVSLFLGMAFVLSNSQINFVKYFQYADVYICFPILLLLIERMVEEKKWMLYCLVLSFIIFSNTYIAFQVCVFLIIWFFFQLGPEVKNKLKCFGIFAGSSILAAIINVASIVNVFVGSSNRLNNTNMDTRLAFANDWWLPVSGFFNDFFMFSSIGSPQEISPNVYFSIIGLILVCLFIVIKINIKQKIYLLACTLFFLASFFNGYLNLSWHLFTPPNGVYNRFSNLYVFTMLMLMLFVLEHLEDIKIWHVIIVGLVLAILGGYSFFDLDHYKSIVVYLTTVLLFALYLMLFILFCRKSISYKGFLVIIVVFGLVELGSNALIQFVKGYNSNAYSDADKTFYNIINQLEEEELSKGERISFELGGVYNFGLIVSKPCISGFSSTINNNMLLLMDKLGMGIGGNVAYSLIGASPLVNLIFNVKESIVEEIGHTDDLKKPVFKEGKYELYETNELAGLGYMVDSKIQDWDIFEGNSFEVQNSFVSCSTRLNDNIFEVINPNIVCTDIENKTIERDEKYIEKNAYVYTYICKYGDERDSIQMEFVADEDMDIYIDGRNNFMGAFSFFIDEQLIGTSSSVFDEATFYLGSIKKGQKITIVTVVSKELAKYEKFSVFLRFAKFDRDAYSKVYDVLSKNVYDIEEMNDEYIKGTIEADKDGIMMTSVQSDSGFDVYVDGKKSEYKIIGGALIGVPLGKGKHNVEFKYVGREKPINGTLISLCGIVLYLILCFTTVINGKRSDKNKLAYSSGGLE